MRVFIANVRANSNHRQLVSLLFEDGTFESLPISEGNASLDESTSAVYCRHLRSHYNPRSKICSATLRRRCGITPATTTRTSKRSPTETTAPTVAPPPPSKLGKVTCSSSLQGWTTPLEQKDQGIPNSTWSVVW